MPRDVQYYIKYTCKTYEVSFFLETGLLVLEGFQLMDFFSRRSNATASACSATVRNDLFEEQLLQLSSSARGL